MMEGDGNVRGFSVDSAKRRDDGSSSGGVRIPKKTNLRRSDSGGSVRSGQRQSRSSSSNNATAFNSQSQAMKHLKRAGSRGSKSLSDSSSDDDEGGGRGPKKRLKKSVFDFSDDDDEGGSPVGRSIVPIKKRSKKSSGESKKRRRSALDGSDSDGDEALINLGKKGKGARRKKRDKKGKNALETLPFAQLVPNAKGGSPGEDDTSAPDDENGKRAASDPSPSGNGVPKRKRRGKGGSPQAVAVPSWRKEELKPRLKVGDRVYAAWWPDVESKRAHSEASWYSGWITHVDSAKAGGEYGPRRYYSIEYDDGDELDGIADVYVMSREDYLLCTEGKTQWKGVRNRVDRDASDMWAKHVGWYVATIDGREVPYSLLTEALRAHDDSVAERLGARTRPELLNLPDEWEGFGEPAPEVEGGSDESDDETLSVSDLKGRTFVKSMNKYLGRIRFRGKDYVLGYYELASDAALAHDEALKTFLGSKESSRFAKNSKAKFTFATDREHRKTRVTESRKRGLNVDFEAVKEYMSSEMDKMMSKFLASVGDDDEGEEKLAEKNRKKEKPPRATSPWGGIDSTTEMPEMYSLDAGKDGAHADPKKKKHSNYTSVSYFKESQKYYAYIAHDGSRFNLGQCSLDADAALSYDVAARLLKGPGARTNFSSSGDYERAKELELESKGLGAEAAMTAAAIESRVRTKLRKKFLALDEAAVPAVSESTEDERSARGTAPAPPETCPELEALNDAMAKKWARYLPKETGQDFLDLYQGGIAEMLWDLKCHGAERADALMPSTVSVGNELSDSSLGSKRPNAPKKIDETAPRGGCRLDIRMDTSSKLTNDASTQSSSLPSKMVLSKNLHKSDFKAAVPSTNAEGVHSKQPKTEKAFVDNPTVPSTVSVATKSSDKAHSAKTDRLNNQRRGEHAGKVDSVEKISDTASQGDNVSIPRNRTRDETVGKVTAARKNNKSATQESNQSSLSSRANPTRKENSGKAAANTKIDDKGSQEDNRANSSGKRPIKSADDTVSCDNSRRKVDNKALMELTIDQMEQIGVRYPVGCSVWFQFSEVDNSNGGGNPGQSFRTGVVTAVSIDLTSPSRDILYKVSLTTGQDSAKQSEMIPEHELYYAPKSPVIITQSSTDTLERKINGEILMCWAKSQHDINIHTVLQLKEVLDKEQAFAAGDCVKLTDILNQLASVQMSRPLLAETLIGKSVVSLKSHDHKPLAKRARELVKKWKDIANEEKDQADSNDHIFAHFYTILVAKKGNQFHVENNVPPERVKYRKVPKVGAEENESSNSTITTATGLC